MHSDLELKIDYRSIDELAIDPDNPRTHDPKQIRQIEKSIKNSGFINPIVCDLDGQIIAGHGRYEAAKRAGLKRAPTICVEHLTEPELIAYQLADNRLAELSEWDDALLKVKIETLLEIDSNCDLDALGFSTAEVDLMFSPVSDQGEAENLLPEMPAPDAVVTRPDDIWILGKNRIARGDCADTRVMERLMGREKADAACSDPPYNVVINGHVSGLGGNQHREFLQGSGEMSEEEFSYFLQSTLSNLVSASRDGAVHFNFMDWRHLHVLSSVARILYYTQLNLCVWVKTNGGMGSLYRSQQELVTVHRVGKTPHINNVELGRHGRNRTNVWHYAGMNAFGAERDEALRLHPTVKPVRMIADALMDVTYRGDLVLDGFLGSGTTLLAAEQTGRRCYGIELDPAYVDVAIRRWQDMTGRTAVLEGTGQTFAELSAERTGAATEEPLDV